MLPCKLGSLSVNNFLRRYYFTKTLSWEKGSSVQFRTEPVVKFSMLVVPNVASVTSTLINWSPQSSRFRGKMIDYICFHTQHDTGNAHHNAVFCCPFSTSPCLQKEHLCSDSATGTHTTLIHQLQDCQISRDCDGLNTNCKFISFVRMGQNMI